MWRYYAEWIWFGSLIVMLVPAVVFPRKYPLVFTLGVSLPLTALIAWEFVSSGFEFLLSWRGLLFALLVGQAGWLAAVIGWIGTRYRRRYLIWGGFVIAILSVWVLEGMLMAFNKS